MSSILIKLSQSHPLDDDAVENSMDVTAVRKRIGSQLKQTFSIHYLAEVGVSAMGFPVSILAPTFPAFHSLASLS